MSAGERSIGGSELFLPGECSCPSLFVRLALLFGQTFDQVGVADQVIETLSETVVYLLARLGQLENLGLQRGNMSLDLRRPTDSIVHSTEPVSPHSHRSTPHSASTTELQIRLESRP